MGAAARRRVGLPAELNTKVYGIMDALTRVDEALVYGIMDPLIRVDEALLGGAL